MHCEYLNNALKIVILINDLCYYVCSVIVYCDKIDYKNGDKHYFEINDDSCLLIRYLFINLLL